MSDPILPESDNSLSRAKPRRFWPRSPLSWIAISLGIVALASWVIFPVLTMAYRQRYPVLDTWVMPAIATTLVDVAVILNLVTVWFRRDRSLLSIVTLAVTLLAGLFFTFMVVGDAIGSA